MTFEVDFLAVGTESQNGDAIALRYGNFSDRDSYRIVVIDGGFKETGDKLVEHIKKFYDTSDEPRVDLVISSHPDLDHASGLRVVLEELDVRELWMHKPWLHSETVKAFTKGQKSALDEALQEGVETAKELEDLAEEHGIPIVEPFEGLETDDGVLRVLGPSEEFYKELVEEIADKEKATARRTLLERARALAATLLRTLQETWNGPEELVEPDENATGPRNQTSTVVLAQLDDKRFLFTGDAGVQALERAVEAGGGDLALTHLQIPHHGSKRNVGPSILDVLLGLRLSEEGATTGKRAIVSCAKKGKPKHPSRRVTNAAIRRGAEVFTTQGNGLWHHSNGRQRDGWYAATPEEFVQDYED